MRDMNPKQHPLLNPDFGKTLWEPVWYLSHPLAPDEKYSFEENMEHTKHMMRLCFDEGFRVVAPYHTICMVLDDDNPEHRRIGLETDCHVAMCLGRIICTGHRMSSGMQAEVRSVESILFPFPITREVYGKHIIDITEMPDAEAREVLQAWKTEFGFEQQVSTVFNVHTPRSNLNG